MPEIVQQGDINTTALVVPDLYVQIVPPQNLVLNGVPSNIAGVVGTAQWGPVNQAVIAATMADYVKAFGTIINRKFDMGTAVAIAVQQGAQNFRLVRVTDGTDIAATGNVNRIAIGVTSASSSGGTGYTPGTQAVTFTGGTLVSGGAAATATCVVSAGGVPGAITITSPGSYSVAPTGFTIPGGSGLTPTVVTGPVTALTFTAAYTGTLGNSISLALSTGSAANSWRLTIGLPGLPPEVFDNLTGSGATFWQNAANAVNNGTGPLRGPSRLVTAAYGLNPVAPAATTATMTGGTDGVSGVTAATLVGADALPRTGMYVLRGQGCSVGMLADADDSTQWTTQSAFSLSEGIYMMLTAAAGTPITNGSTGSVDLKASTGLDCYGCKLLHGDWVYWYDPVNQVIRLVSPQAFALGRLANLSPQNSSLNKPLYGVIGTQKSGLVNSQITRYSAAELGALFQVGIDVIANPQPGGNFWGLRLGHNSSSNAATNGDNYTRMTNYIAATLAAGMGKFVGLPITATLFQQVRATQLSFLQNLLGQGLLGSLDGSLPFGVVCDTSNNPFSRTSLGYVQSDAQVQYMAINEKFLVNLEGGQTVTVTRQTTPVGQIVS